MKIHEKLLYSLINAVLCYGTLIGLIMGVRAETDPEAMAYGLGSALCLWMLTLGNKFVRFWNGKVDN